jgi:ACS family glucarate transporter-like MFS transporter
MGSFILVRTLIGLGEAGGPPNYNRVVANWMAPGERGLALGIVTSGSAMGAAMAPPLIVWIMVTLGWRAAFIIFGVVGMVLALLSYWLIRDDPAEHSRVNQAELDVIRQQGISTRLTADVRKVAAGMPWGILLGRADLWLLTASYAALGYVGYLFFSWFYLYLVNEREFSLVTAGWFSTFPFFISVVAGPIGGWLSDKLSRRFNKRIGRCGFAFGCTLTAAVLICCGAATQNRLISLLCLSLGDGALFLSVAIYWTTTIDLAKPYAGTVAGLMNMGGNLGGAVSPTTTPYIAQNYGWDIALYAAASMAVLAGLLWLGVHPERPIVPDDETATPDSPIPNH